MITQVALSGLEKTLNTVLSLDPDTCHRLNLLSGKVISVHVTGLDWDIYIQPIVGGIQLFTQYSDQPHASIRGSMLDLASLAQATRQGTSSFNRRVEIEGDINTVYALKDILQALNVDWEEQLSKITGDVIAHQVGQTVRGTARWLKHTQTQLASNLTEYLQEEAKLQPTRAELDGFFEAIHALRDDVERLEADLEYNLDSRHDKRVEY